MIAGFGGELISHAYLEQQVLPGIDRRELAAFERAIARWWRQVSRALGPASSARAIHDTAVIPLLQLLGHARPVSQPDARGVRASLDRSDAVVLSVPWIDLPAAAWRDAVRRGASAQVSWALVSNGRSLRIVDCRRAWTRAAIDFDFETLTLSPVGIAVLHLLACAESLAARGAHSLRERVRASDAHASGVCRSLSDGVLDALPALASALKGSRRSDAFDQALTVVYRILFLLFAEARSLVPVWHELYRDAYTIETLTRRAAQSPAGLWEGLQAISRLAHTGCVAGDLSVTAFNGRLFSPRHTPLAEQRRIPDAILRDILLALATTNTIDGRRRISYHDLGVEQLGSVYERVLEYEPQANGKLTRTSLKRKSTGSFYTPRALTEFLVRRTLAPLVDGKSADDILRLRVVDPAMGSGAFLVAACGYLAESCEQALLRDGQWRDRDANHTRATLRRWVAERCLYGVDLNPTAVQLARVSLWLTTLAADRPLTLLDHHLATGNTLVGAWLADLSMPPRSSRARTSLPLFDDQAGAALGACVPARLRLALETSDTVDAVRRKERWLAELGRADAPLARWAAACDAWCAAALSPYSPSDALVREWIAAALGAPTSLPPSRLRASVDQARSTASAHSAFHWEIAFPEVFFDERGQPHDTPGFDAVIGNPPWDMLRADAGAPDQRRDSRASTAAALKFFRCSRFYHHQGTGHPNRYQLFVERALRLVKREGRIGLLLPSGIATDRGSAALRRQLFDHTTIDSWLGFDNRHRIFPIHRSVRFVAMTTTNGGRTATLRFRCGLADADELHREDLFASSLSLTRSRLEDLNPDLNIPEITTTAALSILTGIADRVPALGDPAGWHVRFGRELNATDDRPHFVKLDAGSLELLPVVEGKQLAPFQADIDRSTHGIPIKTAAALIARSSSFDRHRVAYRDVASATNKLTLIAAMLPAGTISTHTVFCLKTPLDDQSQWALLGLMNSLVANYLVRLNVTTHVTTSIISRLRVPKPLRAIEQLATLSQALARFGVEDPSDAYAELNALAARLYGVDEADYRFILDSFPLIPQSQRDRCLAFFCKEIKHGNTETQKHRD